MKGKDGISVVVPTYNNRSLLIRTLKSLFKQTLDKSQYEVIVVDDGSSDGTQEAISVFKECMNLHYLFQEDRGFRVAAARNLGITQARFKTVLFIDTGIVASSRLLAVHLRRHQSEHPVAVIGTSYGVFEYSTEFANLINQAVGENIDDALGGLSHIREVFDCRASYLHSIDYDLVRMSAPWLIFWGGHVSVPTDLLRELGGFDEWFVRWGGEDNELGIRIHQSGCPIQVLREVLSIHLPHPKDPNQKRTDAQVNIEYIHRKHNLPETELLLDHNWECILSRQYVRTNEEACNCVELSDSDESLCDFSDVS
jgi:glycosyltransferase involved in cell wall biosynthesis